MLLEAARDMDWDKMGGRCSAERKCFTIYLDVLRATDGSGLKTSGTHSDCKATNRHFLVWTSLLQGGKGE